MNAVRPFETPMRLGPIAPENARKPQQHGPLGDQGVDMIGVQRERPIDRPPQPLDRGKRSPSHSPVVELLPERTEDGEVRIRPVRRRHGRPSREVQRTGEHRLAQITLDGIGGSTQSQGLPFRCVVEAGRPSLRADGDRRRSHTSNDERATHRSRLSEQPAFR